ncbi:MAG: autotransporter-associated beta strand repeat-containing protein [Prosthecobacter sp.]
MIHNSSALGWFRKHLRIPTTGLLLFTFTLWSVQSRAATIYWDTDASTIGNDSNGAGLGGSGTWDMATSNWWDLSSLGLWPDTNADIAVFTYDYPSLGIPVTNTVTLDSGLTANRLQFNRSGYTLTSGDITLAGITPTLFAQMGETVTINSLIAGTDGLTKLGGGFIRLGNNSNTYTGTTTIGNGGIVITGQGALGLDTGAIIVTGFAPSSSTGLSGADSGTLVLDGLGGDITISRDLSLQGQGATSVRGAALVSSGNNTLSGTVTMGTPYTAVATPVFLNTRIIAADGTLNFTGTLNILGTAATTISNLGGVNQAGASFYNVTGVLAGTGTLEASGGGTLFLNPSDSSGFSGTIRVSASAASGQSVLRIDSPGVLGTRTATTTSSVLDLNGGILAVLMDSPDVRVSNGTNANVYGRASSTIFADHTPNSAVSDQTVAFGQLAFEDNITLTFNSRNGYGMSFSAAPVVGSTAGDNNSTFTNNLQGGAQLTFTGNFWSNANNTGNRTVIFNGNGNTTISGSIIASAAAYDHSLTKSGTGILTLTGTASTLDGDINIQNGTVAISDRRAITNNSSAINLGFNSGSTNTAGILSIIGNNVSQANLTFAKVINLAGTTGGGSILANQTGTSPGVIFTSDFTATGAGAKTLILGGTNIAANTIEGAIVNSTSATSVTKIDAGRWVLAGTNTYTGATTISQGTLQLKANAAVSTILADASAITFNATNVYAGGTLEFIGQASTNNVETLGVLTPTNGSGTVKLTPGSGGTASIVFASLGTVGGGGTVNIIAPTASDIVSFTTTSISNNIANAGLFFNGSDFAFIPGAGLAIRAANYATDADFATSATTLSAGKSNEITGSFSTGALAIDSLKINGDNTLTLTGNLTIRTAASSSASGGIIQTGGSGVITGNFIVGTNGSGTTVINVDGAANTLTLESRLASTGGLTKVGQGTLRLAGANTQTGTISINEGTIRLTTGGTLGGIGALTIRQDAVLELNGVTPTSQIAAFNNNGIVRNTSATTDVTLTVGNGSGSGTSYGIIEDGGLAKVNMVKVGTGNQSWLGLSTYTGTTTIGSTGIVSINNLQNGGDASGIGASSNAASNLIFNGTSTTQAYGGLSYTGTTNDSTDRLFTFDGGANGGVRIQSNGVNQATSSWTNTGALAFGANAAGNPQGLVLGGASTGDNRFSPLIMDNGAAATSLYKSDAGVWYLENTNTYSGVTQINAGTLYAQDGTNIKKDAVSGSNIVLNGGSLAGTGTFTRTLGTAGDQLQWTANGAGGFSAGGSKLTVDWGTGAVWGVGPFIGTGALLLNNSGVAKSDVEIISGFEITQGIASTGVLSATTTAASATVTLTSGTTAGLAIGQEITGNANIPAGYTIATITGPTTFTLNSATGVLAGTSVATNVLAGGYRQINVGDFTSIGADFATVSGVISGAGNLAKEGAGILNLRGANTYTGQTLIRVGTLVVETLGMSGSAGATSVGDQLNANTDAGAIAIGNGGTGAGILEYVGLGETSDRKIRLNTTTGTTQIHADGVGALILTNVVNDMTAGAKTLSLRGTNQSGNMITSKLSDNSGALSITLDSSATWILTNAANDFSGTVSVNGGALGIGADTALGTGLLSFNTGSVFAYGADRTIANTIDQDNNTTIAFVGAYSLNFTQTLVSTAGANNFGLTNSLIAGKTLMIAGMTVNSITANRTWTVDGSGETIFTGDITTNQTTNRGVLLTKTGDGTLELQGTGSNFNRNNQAIDIDRGTIRIGANNVIADGFDDQATPVAYGGITFSPEAAYGDTAILDLNGKNETINALTANTDGTSIIDNTSASAASLTFGAADSAVSFGGGIGTYIIQNSGGGDLSIIKTGAAAATIPTGVTLTYTGTTAVIGGSLTIASSLNGTTGLSVTGGTSLNLTGGISAPGAVTSILVDHGSTLNLLDGSGNKLDQLTSLTLGSSGGSMTTLRLNVGDGPTAGDNLNTDFIELTSGGTLSLFAGNQITLNLTDIGLNAMQTYNLISSVSGGLTSGVLADTDWILGLTPGGFSGITINRTDNLISITTGTLITGSTYWRGLTDTTWNSNANNWSQDKADTIPALSTPGQGTDVIFAFDSAGTGALDTTLEQNFKINSLTFEAGATTPSSVTIASGVDPTYRLAIAPQFATDGIKITTGGPASVIISAPVRLDADQTWSVADSASSLSIGSLLGEADVTKSGAGKVTLTNAADPTFNSGVTATITIDAGSLEITNATALGNTVNANLANVVVNSTGAFYYNGAANSAATGVANNLTLAGGTLSVGGNAGNNYYTGAVNVTADSFVNMRGSNSDVLTATQGNVVLSGAVSGAGILTVDSINTVSSGNQLTGTLYFQADNSSWSGGINLIRGNIQTQTVTGLGTGDITASLGRIQFVTVGGTTYNLAQNITVDAPGGILELSADASGTPVSDMTVNLTGVITIGSAANANNALRVSQASDNFSVINILNSVVLGNNASITYQGSSVRPLIITGVISDGGSGYNLAINDELGSWGVTSRTVRLLGANTFSGNISINEGTLEFDTVTGIGGAASSLGRGTTINVTNTATLSFIGTSAQTTDRPITVSAGVLTLSANGATPAASITYAGTITIPATTSDGSQIILTGSAGSIGIISGGISQTISGTNNTSDVTVNGGTWIHTGTTVVPDDMTVTGATTVLNLNGGVWGIRDDLAVTAGASLNINSAGALSFSTTTLSADASLRAYTGGTISLGATNAVLVTDFDGLRIGTDGTGLGTLEMNAFNQTVTEFILGNRNFDRVGLVNGTGTLTVIGNLDLYKGTINANLASTGSTAFEKIGNGTVTLAGDNSGLTSTGSTILYEGTMIFDYTASNTTKVRTASALDMRGSTLILNGSASAATSQSVGSYTLASGGSNWIILNPGAGQSIVLNLGAITRGNLAQDGTIRFVLPSGVQSATNGITTTSPNSSYGMLGTGTAVSADSAYATVDDGTGVWFATASGGNVVALISTAKDDVSTWSTGDHITDSTGFTGTLASAEINSLRFNAAGGSDLVIQEGGVLLIGSGGFLVTSNVGGTPSVMGGTLASGATELVITQDSAQTFEISSDIRINGAVTKTGTGTLLLSGDNVYTGPTEIQEGILQVTGNSIGDNSLVTLSASRNSTLELLADETIGRLSGGGRNTDSEFGTVAIGDHTLIINNTSNTTYAGFITGTGNLAKMGPGNLALSNLSSGFTGVLTVESGGILLSGIGQINANIIRINKGGVLLIDNNSTTRSGTRILDTTAITLNSADGSFGATATVRGLAIRTDQDATLDETVGVITLNTGASYVGMEATTANDDSDIITANIVRLNRATLNVRGTNLGSTNVRSNQFRIVTANDSAFITANLVGGGGAAGTMNVSIIPWAIGEDIGSNALAVGNMGNSLVTYVSGTGFRPLDFTTEYNTYAAAAATDNVRESLTTDLTLLAGTTINSLVINNQAVATPLNVAGTGASQALNITSGAMLFTVTGAVTNTAYSTILGSFDSGITVGGTNEYVISVVNPNTQTNLGTATGATTIGSTRVTVSSTTGLQVGMAVFGAGIPVGATVASITSATVFEMSLPAVLSTSSQQFVYSTNENLTATISSPLVSNADITKSGRGTLIFTQANTAGGGANKTTINEGTLEISDLDQIGGDTGALVFAGGTLRLGAGFTDDLSLRSITLFDGGGTIDTNGIDLALANNIGSGLGGLTKIGAGNLTLNAAASYTGATTILGGTLTVGANNATGNGGALNLGAGATLDLGTNSITAGLVTTFGISPTISGTGTIIASQGYVFGNTGDIQVAAVLAGSGGLFKFQTNILTLTGANTYTDTTEIQAGTIVFDTIGNVGGGASSLGAPVTVEDGIIRTGLTTTSVTLTYTGSGSSTDRIIGMQGTTGGLTINSDGTGALALGTIQSSNNGAKTLTLGGAATGFVNSVALIHEAVATINVSKTGAGTWALNGANTYTGTTSAGGGVLRAGNSQAFGIGGTVTLINTDSVLELADGVNIANALTISNTGNNKVLQLLSGATSGTWSGNISNAETTAANFDVGADTGGTLTLSGVISGAGGLEKVGAGTVALTNANTYVGTTTTITAGTLQLGDGGTGGSIATTSAISVAAGATFAVNQSDTVTQGTDFSGAAISGAGGFTQAGTGTTVLTATNTYTGQTAVTGGTLSISSEANLGNNPGALTADQLLLNGGTLQTTATLAIDDSNRGITVGSSGGAIETATGTTTTVNSVITGDGVLSKEGDGTLILSVANTNTGATVVNAGVLGGSGGVGGDLMVANGGTMAPGDAGAGQFTVAGNLDVASGGSLAFEIGGATTNDAETVRSYFNTNGQSLTGLTIQASYEIENTSLHDFLSIGSVATTPVINGTVKLSTISSYAPVYGDIFDLLDWAAVGGITGTTSFDFSAIMLSEGLAFNTDLFSSNGLIVVVPEPSRALLLLLGLLGLVIRRRRSAR